MAAWRCGEQPELPIRSGRQLTGSRESGQNRRWSSSSLGSKLGLTQCPFGNGREPRSDTARNGPMTQMEGGGIWDSFAGRGQRAANVPWGRRPIASRKRVVSRKLLYSPFSIRYRLAKRAGVFRPSRKNIVLLYTAPNYSIEGCVRDSGSSYLNGAE